MALVNQAFPDAVCRKKDAKSRIYPNPNLFVFGALLYLKFGKGYEINVDFIVHKVIMRKNAKSVYFGKWFKQIVDSYPEISKKSIAAKAGVAAASFSRILNGKQGASPTTAESLMNALNELSGTQAVNVHEGLKLAFFPIEFPESVTVKIESVFSAHQLSLDFDEKDYQWLAQLIEVRLMWKASQTVDGNNESADFYTPPEDEFCDEPEAVSFHQVNEFKSYPSRNLASREHSS